MSTAGTIYDREIRLGYAKLLSSVNVAGMVTIAFSSSLITTEFDVYCLDLNSLRPVLDAVPLYLYVSDDNGATLKQANYWASTQYTCSNVLAGGTSSFPAQGADSFFRITNGNVISGHSVAGDITFYRALGGGNPCFTWRATTIQDTTFYEVTNTAAGFVGFVAAVPGVNYLVLTFSGSNFSSGNIRLYGLRRGV